MKKGEREKECEGEGRERERRERERGELTSQLLQYNLDELDS